MLQLTWRFEAHRTILQRQVPSWTAAQKHVCHSRIPKKLAQEIQIIHCRVNKVKLSTQVHPGTLSGTSERTRGRAGPISDVGGLLHVGFVRQPCTPLSRRSRSRRAQHRISQVWHCGPPVRPGGEATPKAGPCAVPAPAPHRCHFTSGAEDGYALQPTVG